MIQNEDPIIQKEILLEKFPGKGGWTFARIPMILNQKNPFGWKKVRGSIDDYAFSQYHLMPMGNGHLFLPVKAAIRKKIKKEAGDMVKVILYSDVEPLKIPDDFILCLKDEPQAFRNFQNFSENDQSKYIKWIYSAKTIDQQIERMAEAINRILKDERL
jgi:hypothetical protein